MTRENSTDDSPEINRGEWYRKRLDALDRRMNALRRYDESLTKLSNLLQSQTDQFGIGKGQGKSGVPGRFQSLLSAAWIRLRGFHR